MAIIRYCEGCGNRLPDTIRIDARYCKRDCQNNSARTVKRIAHDVEFRCIDGEGIGRGKDHKYVLLGVGNNQRLENPNGLGWRPILQFLYERFLETPDAVFAGFFLGYDFAQWFNDLPSERAWRVFSKGGYSLRKRDNKKPPLPVDIDDWQLDALPNLKRIRLRPQGNNKWMYICDTGPFFQTSLLNVLDPANWNEPVVSQSEYDRLCEGKLRRDSAVLDDTMRFYNGLENVSLGRVLVRYNRGLGDIGIRLTKKQWFGPGQASQSWLRKINCPTGEEIRNALPDGVHEFAVKTYYAGWFEIMCHGHIRVPAWEYDINSAYPFIMANLPCLLHGKWTSGRGSPPRRKDTYTMVRARVQGSDQRIGAMLHRCSDGTRLARPRRTAGYYWQHELSAAKRAGIVDSIQYEEWHQYKPCNCPPPLREMASLYSQRLAVGKDTPQGKAMKLVYNSGYGKFGQSVGTPVFGNAIYASLITAGCRVMILDAIASHPKGTESVAMVATDGVYFLHKHPSLPIGKELGQWEEKKREGLTLFKPGVYWDNEARMAIRRGSAPVFKARGCNAKAFAAQIQEIDDAFSKWDKRGLTNCYSTMTITEMKERVELQKMFPKADWTTQEKIVPAPWEWPTVKWTLDFGMTTIGQALQWNRWEECGRVSHDIEQEQHSFDNTKRDLRKLRYDGMLRCWRSEPHENIAGEDESTPYDKTFGEEWREEQWNTIHTPDGPLPMLFTGMLLDR